MPTRAEIKARNAKNKEFRKSVKVSSSAKKAAKKAHTKKPKSNSTNLKKGTVRSTVHRATRKILSPGVFSPARAAFDIGMMAKEARDADLRMKKKLLGKTGLKTI